MIISFADRKLRKVCNDRRLVQSKYGERNGKLLMRRLDEILASDNIKELQKLPQARCHELKGNKKGQFAVNLKYPYRLIFEPADIPIPRKPDGGLDLENIKAVNILGMEDYHGKKGNK